MNIERQPQFRPLEHFNDDELDSITFDLQAQRRDIDDTYDEVMRERTRRYAERLRSKLDG
jgi:hypothetical protein